MTGDRYPPLLGLEDDNRNDALGLLLVAVVIGPLLGHDRPQFGPLLGCRRARVSSQLVALDLNLDVRVGVEVEIPRGVLRGPTFGGDDQVVVAVAAVDQRVKPTLARAPARRCEDQGLRPLPVVPLLAAGREVAVDVLLSEQRHMSSSPSSIERASPWAVTGGD